MRSLWAILQIWQKTGVTEVGAADVERARAEAKKVWAIDWAARRTGLSAEEIATFVEAAVARLKAAGENLAKRGNAVVVKS